LASASSSASNWSDRSHHSSKGTCPRRTKRNQSAGCPMIGSRRLPLVNSSMPWKPKRAQGGAYLGPSAELPCRRPSPANRAVAELGPACDRGTYDDLAAYEGVTEDRQLYGLPLVPGARTGLTRREGRCWRVGEGSPGSSSGHGSRWRRRSPGYHARGSLRPSGAPRAAQTEPRFHADDRPKGSLRRRLSLGQGNC
jgi:hypothetical protein